MRFTNSATKKHGGYRLDAVNFNLFEHHNSYNQWLYENTSGMENKDGPT
jgi:hypothetical protein